MAESKENFDNNLSLIKLWIIIINDRLKLLFITLTFLIVSILVLPFIPITTDFKVSIAESSKFDVKGFDTSVYNIEGLLGYSKKESYTFFEKNIQDYHLWQEFLAQNKDQLKINKNTLNGVTYKDFNFKLDPYKQSMDIFLSSTASNEEILINFINFIKKKTLEEMVFNIKASINFNINRLKNRVNYLESKKINEKIQLNAAQKKIEHLISIMKDLSFNLVEIVKVQIYDPSTFRVRPNYALVITLSSVFGFMFGLLFIFLLRCHNNNKHNTLN